MKALKEYNNIDIPHSSQELWGDIFEYSKNLKTNWFVSQQIFNQCFVPIAVENPRLFAKWVDEAVYNSQIRIKQKSKYRKLISLLKQLTFYRKRDKKHISKVLFDLFNTGLNDSYCIK